MQFTKSARTEISGPKKRTCPGKYGRMVALSYDTNDVQES